MQFLRYTSLLSIILIFFSCKTKSKQELIIGYWKVEKPSRMGGALGVEFFENGKAVARREGNVTPTSEDTITYYLNKEGNILVSKDESGHIKELGILQLTTDKLILLPNHYDTLRFTR